MCRSLVRQGKAWVYRAMQGNFKVADGTTDQGQAYGSPFAIGSNVTAVYHNSTSLQFFLDGHSQGLLQLSASDALPSNVVPCAGVCPRPFPSCDIAECDG